MYYPGARLISGLQHCINDWPNVKYSAGVQREGLGGQPWALPKWRRQEDAGRVQSSTNARQPAQLWR